MDIEAPQWDDWEARFTALAEEVPESPTRMLLANAQRTLCFLGDNGLTPEQELLELDDFISNKSRLYKVSVETSYWQDIVLFEPAPTSSEST